VDRNSVCPTICTNSIQELLVSLNYFSCNDESIDVSTQLRGRSHRYRPGIHVEYFGTGPLEEVGATRY